MNASNKCDDLITSSFNNCDNSLTIPSSMVVNQESDFEDTNNCLKNLSGNFAKQTARTFVELIQIKLEEKNRVINSENVANVNSVRYVCDVFIKSLKQSLKEELAKAFYSQQSGDKKMLEYILSEIIQERDANEKSSYNEMELDKDQSVSLLSTIVYNF